MVKFCLQCALVISLFQFAVAAEMPRPDSQWRIAGLNFGVRHMIRKDSLCVDNKIDTFAMANIDQAVLSTIYNRVVDRVRLICRVPGTQQIEMPVRYHVVDVPVASYILVSNPNEYPTIRLDNKEGNNTPEDVSPLFQSYWDSYGDPEFRLPRSTGEVLPTWADADYLYALAVDREVPKVGTYDVYFDSAFDSGPLIIVDANAFEQAIKAEHPLALIMSMLDVMPYAGMTEYDIEEYWRYSFAQIDDVGELKAFVNRLVEIGYLQGDLLDSFLQRMDSAGSDIEARANNTASGKEEKSSASALPELEINDNTASSAIQDYYRRTDCDLFPRVFFNDPKNNTPKRIALAASLYSFAAGGCASGIRNAETIITLSSAMIDECSNQGSKYQCGVIAQYQCDGNNFLRGTAQAKLACSVYLDFLVNSKSIWMFEYNSNARQWLAEFVSK